jgi:hypothetical protein
MLLHGTIIAALLLALLMAWVAGAIVCLGTYTFLLPKAGWMKRVLLSGGTSAVLLGPVFMIDTWTGIDDLSLFMAYLVGSLGAAALAIAYLAFQLLRSRS